MTRWQRLRRWLERRFELGQVAPAPGVAIEDGVDYRRPPVVPGDVARRGAGHVRAYLLETAQQPTMRGQFDAPNRSAAYDGPVMMPTDDPLAEWGIDTRKMVLTNCHAAFHRNPLAKQAVVLTRQFAVGKGFAITYRNQAVQAVIEAFLGNPENATDEYQKTFIQDLQVDGELFIRFFQGDDGQVVIVPLPPWHVVDIETEPGFFRRVQRYHLVYWDGQRQVDEWVLADEILHVAINRHSYELRGRPDLFVILPWLRAYKEWLENRARQNKWRNALLWDVTIAGASPGSVANAAARYRTPPPDGSIVVHSDKETWQAVTNPSSAGDVAEDGRQIKLMNAVGVGLPEYMLSDGENANLASATAQELPALWKFTDVQQIMAEQVWTPIFKRVVNAAVLAGVLPAEVPEEDSDGDPVREPREPDPVTGEVVEGPPRTLAAVDAFEVAYPELQAQDPKTLAEALQIATLNEWVSNETASTEMGFDYPVEQKKIERERQRALMQANQGQRDFGSGPEADEGTNGATANGREPARMA